MNLPNVLTILRMILAVLFAVLMERHAWLATVLAGTVFAVATLTDFWDGFLARKYKLQSNFGTIMDPIADKVLMLTAFMIFAQMGVLQAWLVWVIAAREIMVTASRLLAVRRGYVLAAETLGKIKTVCQMTTIAVILLVLVLQQAPFLDGCALLHRPFWMELVGWLMTVTVAITVVSGISFYVNKRKLQ